MNLVSPVLIPVLTESKSPLNLLLRTEPELNPPRVNLTQVILPRAPEPGERSSEK